MNVSRETISYCCNYIGDESLALSSFSYLSSIEQANEHLLLRLKPRGLLLDESDQRYNFPSLGCEQPICKGLFSIHYYDDGVGRELLSIEDWCFGDFGISYFYENCAIPKTILEVQL